MNGGRDCDNDSDGIGGSCRAEGIFVVYAFSHARSINSMAAVEGIEVRKGWIIFDGRCYSRRVDLGAFGDF